MHPRNKLFPILLAAILSLVSIATGQAPPAQSSAPAPQAQTQPTPAQQPAGEPTLQQRPEEPQAAPGRNQDTVQMPAQRPQQGTAPAGEQNGVFIFKKNVEEVVLHATVVDEHGRLVTTLGRDAFQVYEDGKPVQITSFRREDIPVALGIIIDNSGSMREKRPSVNRASLNLVRASNPQDQVFIVNFNDEYWLDQDFTNDVDKLKEGLEHIESRGGTALYDAVIASANHLKKNARLEKRVLLVVTDGEDNSSRESLEQAVRQLSQEDGPTVYTIGILGEERAKRAKRALSALSEQTGGLAFFPKDVSEVDSISQAIARDIRNQYTIGFKKQPGAATAYRTVKVTARAPGYKNLQVRTLSGYFAGQERASR